MVRRGLHRLELHVTVVADFSEEAVVTVHVAEARRDGLHFLTRGTVGHLADLLNATGILSLDDDPLIERVEGVEVPGVRLHHLTVGALDVLRIREHAVRPLERLLLAIARAVAILIVVQEVGAPVHLTPGITLHGVGRHGGVGNRCIGIEGTAEDGTLHDGQARIGVGQRVAVGHLIVVVEVLLVFADQLVPHLIGRSHHPVDTVLRVDTGTEEVAVEQVVLLLEHRVEIDGLTVDESALHTLLGQEFLAVEVAVVEETAQAVEVGILTQILEHGRMVVDLTVDREQHAVLIQLVGRDEGGTAGGRGGQHDALAVHQGQ